MDRIAAVIRNIPDFPRPGIQFKDLTPLIRNAGLMRLTVHRMIDPFIGMGVTAVAGMEARGFVFGSLAAWQLGVGFIPLRKPGKLPYTVQSASYDLEYGSAELQVHTDAAGPQDRILLVDDLIATGGTAAAGCELMERLGAVIVGCVFVVELDALKGRQRLGERRVHSLLHY